MNMETLSKANRLASEISRWMDIELRLSLSSGFFSIEFRASKNKSMDSEFTQLITDKKTIDTYKEFVSNKVIELQKEFKEL